MDSGHGPCPAGRIGACAGWVRGAVSGIGILNLGMGLWELINFRQTVRALDSGVLSVESSGRKLPERVVADGTEPAKADPLSDYPRRNR
jgi:hypothetical protein